MTDAFDPNHLAALFVAAHAERVPVEHHGSFDVAGGQLDLADLPQIDPPPNETSYEAAFQPADQMKAGRSLMKEIRSRSVWWVVGTSLGFEAVVLALAAWIFSRRDY